MVGSTNATMPAAQKQKRPHGKVHQFNGKESDINPDGFKPNGKILAREARNRNDIERNSENDTE
jgi:hypothetical protein